MTKQDNNPVSYGYIGIGGGFKPNTPSKSYFYPKDRLASFLNFKSRNGRDIFEFCTKYQLIYLAPNQEKVLKLFIKDQRELRKVARKLEKGYLDPKDIENINKKLGAIKIMLGNPAEPYPSSLKNPAVIPNVPAELKKKFTRNYLFIVKKHPNGIVSLWEDLLTRFIEKRDMKICINCGDFFIVESKHERKYCSKPQCKNTHSKRASRMRKKLQIPQG